MRTLNLGILAHVDAGKTTLTERLLHSTGAIGHLGRVDHGDTTTDTDELERRRGITIRAAVATMRLPSDAGEVKVNLIDTPGHSDFVAEVERALAVLDGAVLVVSAVDGVQAQTRVLVRILERMRLPFLIFVNKVDSSGASVDRAMGELRQLLRDPPVLLTRPLDVEGIVEAVSPWDEELLRDYVERREPPGPARLLAAVAEQSRQGRAHPVLAGSALRGVGVSDLLAALPVHLPLIESAAADADDGSVHATVFRIDRDAGGHRIAYLRMHAGRLAPRDVIALHRRAADGHVGERDARALDVRVFERGAQTEPGVAHAGDVAVVAGLGEVAVSDQLGHWDPARSGRHFPDPGMESVVQARDPAQRMRLFEALRQLAEQDPLIDARVDGADEVTITVYGEVQKEVLAARLAEEYGVAADFLPTRVVHVERVSGTGEGQAKSPMGHIRIGLAIRPAPAGRGLDYGLAPGVEKGWLLPQYHQALESQLAAELAEGLHGWRIADLKVRTVASRWAAPVPSPADFRAVTHLAFRRALAAAGTVVCAPLSRFHLETPVEMVSTVLSAAAALGGATEQLDTGAVSRIVGTMPTAHVAEFEQRVPGYTAGRGVFWSEPAGYVPVIGTGQPAVR